MDNIEQEAGDRNWKSIIPKNNAGDSLPQQPKCRYCNKDLDGYNRHIDAYANGQILDRLEMCGPCFITALHAIDLGYEVTQECQKENGVLGRRIYVAVEAVGQESELVSARMWLGGKLSEDV